MLRMSFNSHNGYSAVLIGIEHANIWKITRYRVINNTVQSNFGALIVQ